MSISPHFCSARGRANVRIVLRRPDTVTVAVIDTHRHEVATLASAAAYRRGEAKFQWDGRTDSRTVANDGAYRVRIHLARQHQTIVLPNTMLLDTKAPDVEVVDANRQAFSPDGDNQADFVRIAYKLSKPAHVLLYLGGRRILETY